jgi:adenylosuccinate lyase
MKVWREGADFLSLLQADPQVTIYLDADALAPLFDLGYHTKHVDTIFTRVFGRS